MTTTDERDPWLEVLAGRAEPSDPDTRQAAEVRRVLFQRLEAAHGESADDRLLARIRAFNATLAASAVPAVPAVPVAPPSREHGWLSRLTGWLGIGPGAAPLGTMAAAAAVAALAVGLFFSTGRDNEHEQIKSAPPASAPADGTSVDAPIVVTHPQPLAEASRVGSRLRAAGLAVEVLPLGDAAQLGATVPPERRQAVRQILAQEQIAWPGGDRLELRWQQAR